MSEEKIGNMHVEGYVQNVQHIDNIVVGTYSKLRIEETQTQFIKTITIPRVLVPRSLLGLYVSVDKNPFLDSDVWYASYKLQQTPTRGASKGFNYSLEVTVSMEELSKLNLLE